jgi:hypothetical protein
LVVPLLSHRLPDQFILLGLLAIILESLSARINTPHRRFVCRLLASLDCRLSMPPWGPPRPEQSATPNPLRAVPPVKRPPITAREDEVHAAQTGLLLGELDKPLPVLLLTPNNILRRQLLKTVEQSSPPFRGRATLNLHCHHLVSR